MNALFILNESAYGSERSYNGLRLALSLAKSKEATVRIFLQGEAVTCALAGQKPSDGHYNLEHLLEDCSANGVWLGCCGRCMDARGITEERLAANARRSTVAELTEWTLWADKVLTF